MCLSHLCDLCIQRLDAISIAHSLISASSPVWLFSAFIQRAALLHCDLHCSVQHSTSSLCTLSQSLSLSIDLVIDSSSFHCILVVFSLVSLSMSFVPVILCSSQCVPWMYVSDYPIMSLWSNPFSCSAIDRAYRFGLYPPFVHETLALPVF